mmetsp:Transcript_286/g.560  ORF Transcript_286/g.560 Transcript_286/m.560 type:complete len:368 (+) Transcript_286:663-1766(+)
MARSTMTPAMQYAPHSPKYRAHLCRAAVQAAHQSAQQLHTNQAASTVKSCAAMSGHNSFRHENLAALAPCLHGLCMLIPMVSIGVSMVLVLRGVLRVLYVLRVVVVVMVVGRCLLHHVLCTRHVGHPCWWAPACHLIVVLHGRLGLWRHSLHLSSGSSSHGSRCCLVVVLVHLVVVVMQSSGVNWQPSCSGCCWVHLVGCCHGSSGRCCRRRCGFRARVRNGSCLRRRMCGCQGPSTAATGCVCRLVSVVCDQLLDARLQVVWHVHAGGAPAVCHIALPVAPLVLQVTLCLALQLLVVLVDLGPLEAVSLHAVHQRVHLTQSEALLGANAAATTWCAARGCVQGCAREGDHSSCHCSGGTTQLLPLG